jgi:hypothetical protein
MQDETRMSLISLSRVFNKLYLKVIDPSKMEVLKDKVAKTMSSLAKNIPPICFNVMTRLVVHLVEELDMCGPIHT